MRYRGTLITYDYCGVDRFTWGIVAGAILLVIIGLVSVTAGQRPSAAPDLSQPEGVVRAYEDALNASQPERAWDLLSVSARSNVTRDEFIRRATSMGRSSAVRTAIESVDASSDTAHVVITRTYDSGGGLFGSGTYTNRQTFRLERESGQWRISVPADSYLINRVP